MAGIICMLSDPQAERVDEVQATPLGYALCLLASFCGAIYIMMKAELVKVYPIFFLIIVKVFLASICMTAFFNLNEPENYQMWSTDK